MENTQNQQSKTNLTQNSLSNVQLESAEQYFEILKICALCDNRFNYTAEQLSYWAKRLVIKYPKLTEDAFRKIIENGTEGKLGDENYHPIVTFSVICGWVESGLKINSITTGTKFL